MPALVLPLMAAAVNLEEGALALVLKAAELVLLSRSRGKVAPASMEPERQQAAGRIALLADDSPIVRDIVAQALRSYGLHVLVAGDGAEALEIFGAQNHVDIVLTDIDMPRLDGLGLVRALRSRQDAKDLPVVAISMRGSGSGDHLDFLAFAGHKMYAPFGAGVLLGDARLLSATAPDEIGGGTVANPIHRVAILAQTALHTGANHRVVFNEQQTHSSSQNQSHTMLIKPL